MRKFGLAIMAVLWTGLGFFGNPAPAQARDYPWCLQGRDTGYPGECSYQTYGQCMMSASGRNAGCGINPRFAYGRYGRGPRGW